MLLSALFSQVAQACDPLQEPLSGELAFRPMAETAWRLRRAPEASPDLRRPRSRVSNRAPQALVFQWKAPCLRPGSVSRWYRLPYSPNRLTPRPALKNDASVTA